MSLKEYHLRMEGGDVIMSYTEFIALAGELEAMGVHVNVLAIDLNKAIVFKVDQRRVVGGNA